MVGDLSASEFWALWELWSGGYGWCQYSLLYSQAWTSCRICDCFAYFTVESNGDEYLLRVSDLGLLGGAGKSCRAIGPYLRFLSPSTKTRCYLIQQRNPTRQFCIFYMKYICAERRDKWYECPVSQRSEINARAEAAHRGIERSVCSVENVFCDLQAL